MAKIKFDVPEEFANEVYTDGITDDEAIVDQPEEVEDTEQFYTGGKYEELREAMKDTDFRLFLVGNDLVIPGTLEGDDIQFLDIVGDEDNEEFVLKPAPKTINEVLDFRTLYNVDNTEVEIPEDKEVSEAPHEKIIEYILNLKLVDKDTDDVEDDETEINKKENEEKEEDENESNE